MVCFFSKSKNLLSLEADSPKTCPRLLSQILQPLSQGRKSRRGKPNLTNSAETPESHTLWCSQAKLLIILHYPSFLFQTNLKRELHQLLSSQNPILKTNYKKTKTKLKSHSWKSSTTFLWKEETLLSLML